MNTDSSFERNSDMMVADMDGELVMMDVTQGTYFAINPVGSHIWTALETPKSLAALTASVKAAFKVANEAQIQADIDQFIADLEAHDLIREVSV